ncbi:MAG: Holliday junction resolvase RuvX [Actinobacteria bacterium]|nr:Holliday junction resolvase RuvX [Actinomycetota bacterium]
MKKGRKLGLDFGSTRIGVAICDPDGILATPFSTLPSGPELIAQISSICESEEIVAIVVGLPRSLSGEISHAANLVNDFIMQLTEHLPDLPILTFDERFTTTLANQALRASGRSAKDGRVVIDQIAAVNILQSYLDANG